ncbi:MAG: alanine racemase [Planctomycetes bacterium]|nr:alanine racemase [Planctomycetota bacterium]
MLRNPDNRAPRSASTWVEIDLGAVARNVVALRWALPSGCRLIAVVKSDGYGHGMVRVARTALQAGANELAVATVDEGAVLRESGVTAPILVAGPIAAEQAGLIVQHGLVPSLGCHEVAAALARVTRRFLPVQIEVDTGMTRHGVPAEQLGAFVKSVQDRGRLSIAGVFTHFAGVGPDDLPSMRRQLAVFLDAVDSVRALRGVRRHCCNTLGAMLMPDACLDAVRIGGGLYGFDPLDGAGRVSLQPVMTLKTVVVGLRNAAVGEAIGYGGEFVCRRPSRLALLPIGYGDGLVRELWRGAEVLIRGRRAPIVGAVSMNQIVVDVTGLPEVVFGEQVVLLGAMGDERVTADERVLPGGSAYQVTTLLSPRLPRRFLSPRDEAIARPAGAGEVPEVGRAETLRPTT